MWSIFPLFPEDMYSRNNVEGGLKDLFHPCASDRKRWKRAPLAPQTGLSVLEVISELIRFVSQA